MSMDDILNDEVEQETTESNTQVEPENNTESEEARATGDTGDTPQSEPAEEKEEPKMVPLEAHIDERKKRQEYEKRNQELERQISYMHGQVDSKPPVEPEKPIINEDEFWANPADALKQHGELIAQQIQENMWQKDLKSDVARMKKKHSDYMEKEQEFAKLASANPVLYEAVRETRNPAEYAYNYVKSLERQKDPDALRSEIRAEVEAELKEKLAKEAAKSTPQTQAESRGGQAGTQTHEKTSLDDIIGPTGCNQTKW